METDGRGIELIQASAKAEHHEQEIDGVLFSTKKMEPIYHDPRPAALGVQSLTAIVDYLKSEIDFPMIAADKEARSILLHVVSPTAVEIVSRAGGPAVKRTTWLSASAPENPFRYGQKYDPENFNIALQSLFVDSDDRACILKLAGTVKSEAVKTDTDDGVTQKVEVRKNIAFAAEAKIPNPVTLRPWRTFREVEQPSSIFVLRAHDGPAFALYEADGAAWKLEAMQSIKAWLAERLPDVAIIA
jgi:hypothetical protein